MKCAIVIVAMALALAGCSDKPEPRWVHACVETRTDIIVMPTRVGDVTYMRPQPVTRCVTRQWQCHMSESHDGEQCGPLPLEGHTAEGARL